MNMLKHGGDFYPKYKFVTRILFLKKVKAVV